jgi:hypothetical protein
MSYAATHRHHHHIHVPWQTIAVVAVAVAAATAVLVLVNLPATTVIGNTKGAAHHAGRVHQVVPTTSVAVMPVSAQAAVVALPETPALRHRLAADLSARAAQEQQYAYPRNHVMGATAGTFAAPAVALRHFAAKTAPSDPHPLNHFPGEP